MESRPAMSLTPSLPNSLQLASDEVHCWCAGLNVAAETAACLYETLTPDERRRSGRFRFERDRRRFVAAHGVLRHLLGRYLEIRPGRLRFVHNAFGKPALSPEFGTRLTFNLSHSADLALIAVTAAATVGVDIECVRQRSDDREIARHFFSPSEVDYLMSLPSHLYADAFFSCWTKKEAYVKAHGEGLSIPLNSFSVPLEAKSADAAETDVANRWSFYALRPAPGYAGAVAIEGTGWRLRQWQWGTSPPEPES